MFQDFVKYTCTNDQLTQFDFNVFQIGNNDQGNYSKNDLNSSDISAKFDCVMKIADKQSNGDVCNNNSPG